MSLPNLPRSSEAVVKNYVASVLFAGSMQVMPSQIRLVLCAFPAECFTTAYARGPFRLRQGYAGQDGRGWGDDNFTE